jgi:hypothetical protein
VQLVRFLAAYYVLATLFVALTLVLWGGTPPEPLVPAAALVAFLLAGWTVLRRPERVPWSRR